MIKVILRNLEYPLKTTLKMSTITQTSIVLNFIDHRENFVTSLYFLNNVQNNILNNK